MLKWHEIWHVEFVCDLYFVLLLCVLKGKKIDLFRGGQISSWCSQDKHIACGGYSFVVVTGQVVLITRDSVFSFCV